ncbi:MAG TPA: EAL domain-containing protein [Mycobacteriales bacterium]|nr:EAL domain-containing protein [Mycobacteriales bacterium]
MSTQDEVQDLAPRRGAPAFWTYVTVIVLTGGGLLVPSLLGLHGGDLRHMGTAFVVIAALVLVGELRPVVTAGSPDANGVSTSTAFVFALLLHWGLGVALLMQTVATIVADMVRHKAPWRTAFNVAQCALSYGAAALMLWLFGDLATPRHPLLFTGAELPAFALAGIVFFAINNGLVSGALALHDRSSLREKLFSDLSYQLFSSGALLGLAPIVVIVMERSAWLIPLLLLPILAVYATAEMSLERERQAYHDALTGLGNRKLLVQDARNRIQEADDNNLGVALFLLDLDRFKEINDTLGHQVGDALLQLVGERLLSVVRPEDTVARLGGDEFAILVTDVGHLQRAMEVADRVRSALGEPFRHDSMSFEIDASIGVALHPDHGHDFETLLQRADVAMYVAKERNTGIEVYSSDTDRHSTMRLGMMAELRTALENGDLELHFQPKADLRTRDVVGLEALLRWRHPERGMVPPDEFIPLAEQTGLMRAITQFVVDAALKQLAEWWGQGLRVQAAINVCARDLYDRDFADFLRHRLAEHGVPPRALMVEVTEGVLMADPSRAASTLLSLADVGVGVSLDDFGTGYSSLVHLKRLPVSEVKIDRSFVMRMDVNEDDAAIVRSIIDLASALGLRVVAEGVETQEAWDRLSVYGCDAAQGWYLAPALPPAEMTRWLKDYVADGGSCAREPGAVVPAQSRAEEPEQRRSALA